MSETNVSLNAELRDELADEIEAKIAESKKADVLLDVDDLCVTLFTEDGELPAIRHLNFVMRKGETLAVVGESGCGKSMTALSIMGLLPQPPAKIVGGSINLEGTDLAKLSRDEMRSFRGSKIGMIFQEPMTSLNPVMKAGLQIREGILVHNPKMNKKEADARALEMIKLVGIPAPEKVFKSYPHELSGGMRQRVMIAMALACQPSLLICDEPTTALDVTIQAQILQLIDRMREELGTAAVEKLYAIPGNVPTLNELPSGCPFHPRCPYAKDVCRTKCPHVSPLNGDENHTVACWMFDSEEWGE